MIKFKINESKRDDLLLRYMELLNNNGINVNIGQVKSKLLNKFVVEGNIHNLSLRSNFYLAGVARYYFEGSLTKNKDLSLLKPESWQGQDIQDTWDVVICKKLDALINVLRNAYIDTVGTEMLEPEDLGELPLKDLLKKYNKEIKKELGVKVKKKTPEIQINTDEHVGNGYTFDIMYSHNDCKKYNAPTSPGSWCITYGQNHYDAYVRSLNIHYVIFRQDGWENIQRPSDPLSEPGFTSRKPHDIYGNSLIALLQSNTSPEPVYITSRWNHGYEVHCEADHAYTKEEFQQITGVTDADLKRIYDIWNTFKGTKKTNSVNKKEDTFINRSLKYLQMRINAGENPEKLFYKVRNIFGSQKINKGTFLCGAKISETTMGTNERLVYFLFDSGKIIFNTVCTNESAFSITENLLVTITLNENKHLLYSLKHHRLLSINGVCFFRRVPDLSEYIVEEEDFNKEFYFEVKQGQNDIALFSSRTMEPLQLPNGEYWFNLIKSNVSYYYGYGTRIECFVYKIEGKTTCFTIIYDNSSGEQYFYNTATKSFFDIKVPSEIKIGGNRYNRYEVTTEQSDGYTPFIDYSSYDSNYGNIILVKYGKRDAWYNGHYYYETSAYQILKDGKIFSIDNESWFIELSNIDNTNKSMIRKLDGTYIVVNQDLTKYLDLGDFNIMNYDTKSIEDDELYLILKNNSQNSVIYNDVSDGILISPTKSIVFHGVDVYSSLWGVQAQDKKVKGHCFEFTDISGIPKQWFHVGDFYENNSLFRISFHNLNYFCKKQKPVWVNIDNNQLEQGAIQLNRNDVENMVNESLKRILKRIISA